MAGELRTSLLSPQKYHSLFHLVATELRPLPAFLAEAGRSPVATQGAAAHVRLDAKGPD